MSLKSTSSRKSWYEAPGIRATVGRRRMPAASPGFKARHLLEPGQWAQATAATPQRNRRSSGPAYQTPSRPARAIKYGRERATVSARGVGLTRRRYKGWNRLVPVAAFGRTPVISLRQRCIKLWFGSFGRRRDNFQPFLGRANGPPFLSPGRSECASAGLGNPPPRFRSPVRATLLCDTAERNGSAWFRPPILGPLAGASFHHDREIPSVGHGLTA